METTFSAQAYELATNTPVNTTNNDAKDLLLRWIQVASNIVDLNYNEPVTNELKRCSSIADSMESVLLCCMGVWDMV